jgi:TrkA-N domain/RyR domain
MAEESTPNPLASSKSRSEAVILVLAIAAVLGLAIFGWIETAEEHHLPLGPLDLIADVQETIFGKEYILITSKPEESHWAVTVATYGAKILLAYALIRGAIVLLGRRAGQWWFRNVTRPSGHTVVLGAGRRGSILARRLKERGESVVIVEKDEDNEFLPELLRSGIHWVHGNALDKSVLISAGVSSCGRLISLLPDDEKNISAGGMAAEMGAASVVSGVEDYGLRYLFRSIPKLRLVGFEARAARKIMCHGAELIARDQAVRARGACIVIDATNPLRDEFIRAASVFLQISGDVRPVIHVAHSTVEEKRDFQARYPDAFRVIDIHWHDGPADEIPAKAVACPDLAIFQLGDDVATLDASERFRMACGRGMTDAKNRIFACLRDSTELLKLSKQHGSFCATDVFVESLGDGDPLDDSREALAKAVHEAYLAKNSGSPWDQITEMEKDSNRLAALHNEVKKAVWATRKPEEDDAVIDLLARSEHLRWMAEKVMDGWRWSGSLDKSSRDNSLKLHHLFVPYDELSKEEKEKDVTVVKELLSND